MRLSLICKTMSSIMTKPYALFIYNDMKLVVWKNHLGGQILYRVRTSCRKKRRPYLTDYGIRLRRVEVSIFINQCHFWSRNIKSIFFLYIVRFPKKCNLLHPNIPFSASRRSIEGHFGVARLLHEFWLWRRFL